MTITTITTTGHYEIFHQSERAIEALAEWLHTNPDFSLATFTAGENMNVTAVISDDIETVTLHWTSEGWRRADWLERKREAETTEALLDPLPVGTEFRLDHHSVGRAYVATYRKNDLGLWDQLEGTCEAPHVINMSGEHLGFCVGAEVVREALLLANAQEEAAWERETERRSR